MTDKEPQGEELQTYQDFVNRYGERPPDIVFKIMAEYIQDVKLPAPGTEAYQKLREKIVSLITRHTNATNWADEIADSVLALLGEEK